MSQAPIETWQGQLIADAYAAQDRLREDPSIEAAVLAFAAEQAALEAVR